MQARYDVPLSELTTLGLGGARLGVVRRLIGPELIDEAVPRRELQAAVATITELVPADVDDDGVKREQLATRDRDRHRVLKALTGVNRVRRTRRRAAGPGTR
jgi:hypothetical protein